MFDIFGSVVRWSKERLLYDIPYRRSKHAGNISEELSELLRANTPEEEIDAYCDIIVYAINAIESAGYNAEQCLEETLEEIESRTGNYIASEGKWCKSKTPEAKAKWYKANYKSAKRTVNA